MSGQPLTEIRTFTTSGGANIYQLPLELFPWMWGYAYLVRLAESAGSRKESEGGQKGWVLIDSGSGYGNSNRHLDEGFRSVSSLTGEAVSYQDLAYILVTHGHIDHVGGLPHVLQQTGAPLGVHELDRRILTHYEERVIIAARRLGEFLVEAGVGEDQLQHLMKMYQMTKSLFRSVRVDFTYEAMGMCYGPFEFLHVPGHCAGHVAIRLDDIIFCGDHILSGTSPHQAPERLTLSTGLEHYLLSLKGLVDWGQDARLLLGGHEDPVTDLRARTEEIQAVHRDRLERVLELADEPFTIASLAAELFGEVNGYHELLAIEEAGAHVEYLYQRGLLEIANLDELENSLHPAPVRYRAAIHRKEDADNPTGGLANTT
jgi:glyoxylase-like metal-dependent hydrolase (beta-lactamase superfamily II)